LALARAKAPVAGTDDEAGAWFAALEELFPIPAEYRREEIDRAGALDTLRCGDAVLEELIARGLPCSGEPGRERFDRNDLFNLALYSGSARSVPVMAFRFALRWMSEPASTWFEPRRWTVSIELGCGRPGGCGADPRWWLARPMPGEFDGRLGSLAVEPAEASMDERSLVLAGPGGLRLSGVAEIGGKRMRLRSSRLRKLVDEFLAEGYRWVKLPEELEREPDEVLPLGAANCLCASIELVRRFRAAGFEAHTRRGWLLGMFDFEHMWVEVRDDDGVVKVVDSIFPLLGAMIPNTNPEFAAVCFGSRMNRLLPTRYAADESLAGHVCGGSEAPLDKRVDIRRQRARRDSTAGSRTT
jgi:hypothetical protein